MCKSCSFHNGHTFLNQQADKLESELSASTYSVALLERVSYVVLFHNSQDWNPYSSIAAYEEIERDCYRKMLHRNGAREKSGSGVRGQCAC